VGASETLNMKAARKKESSDENEVRVSFSASVYEMLEEIAQRKGKSVTEVIEDAIGLERWYLRTRDNGERVIIEGKNGDVWELVHD
jgi:hypothetical protein